MFCFFICVGGCETSFFFCFETHVDYLRNCCNIFKLFSQKENSFHSTILFFCHQDPTNDSNNKKKSNTKAFVALVKGAPETIGERLTNKVNSSILCFLFDCEMTDYIDVCSRIITMKFIEVMHCEDVVCWH